MGSNNHRSYQEDGSLIYGWGFSSVGLIHGDINTKKRVLLQLSPHVHLTTVACTIEQRVITSLAVP